ncbi:MAG: hypothetical protein GX335_01965 [Firmicutes bacterium]|nr:hypothetical protein [Bacillota bacterium]
MIYDNPNYRRVRGSRLILVSCGYCQTKIALYQKAGPGGLLRMYVERIVKSSVDLSTLPGALSCPNCKKQLATKVTLKRRNKEAYALIRSVFNTAEVHR